ncbi:restriction endonuclease subunit S [Campylobacter concisus]|uniref:restriction endonuclease subunit S n=1 Tax=Campylobacter concisus TaxID=199 RepID=UPI00122CCE97|nr:restriction endonuclease subunit S [Campylobacter concisus]
MQVLEKYFDTAFDAPDGIKKLRELILTLAMQGKLVPQDTNDQPASELLKKLKKIKNIPAVNSNEISFSLPQNWKWERIVNLGITQTGTTPPKKDPDNYGNFIPFIGPGNIKNGIIEYSGEGLSEKGIEKGRLIEKDSILMVCIGGSIGKHAMTNQDISCNQQINTITVYPELSTQYVYWAMASQYFQNTVINQAGGSATPIINKLKWSSIPIPIPPLNEQKRIVDKINQLMALCDELEKLKVQKEAKKLAVHKSAINQLLDSKDDSNSKKGWNFISNNFNDLYTVKENVSELRSAILQLAMQGKLVPQDPNEQPASELLKEIEKEKKANKVKSLEPIKSESIPYDLPNGWQWVYLNDFGVWKSGSTPSRTNSAYYGGDIPWVKSGEVKQGLIKKTEETITQKALDECSLGLNPIGSVLVAMYGANIGEVGILEVEATTNQAICACQTFSKINNQFLKFLIDSLKGYFISQGAGAAQPNISRVKIINSIVPLPPFNEQQRIVEKINQLMALCDELEKQIENSSSKQTQLLNAIMSNSRKIRCD